VTGLVEDPVDIIRGERVVIRPTEGDDLDLLAKWFADPHVVAWWGGRPKSRDEVETKYLSPVDGRLAFVIEGDGEPIGYIQAWSDLPPDGGIDLVLVQERRGRGLGVDAARSLARHLRGVGWRRIIVDPQATNHRAITAFEKAGFVRQREENEQVIMAFEPDATVFIGGSESGVIVLSEYDPAWPLRFEAERARIDTTLGARAKTIEHIGSTAVPGLAAKPIIDILVCVDDVEDESSYVARLENADYVLRVREPGHRMFRTLAKDVHVHIWSDPTEISRHIAFRDRLRANDEDRRRYEFIKRKLAQRRWSDTNEYAEAKTGVIAEIMAAPRPEEVADGPSTAV
jgi:GrpB-like predicted nucleotidyltransferase (UPF0157 family)/GNAT superfamily N-acetyltransferase